jgi:hypothetical protein
MLGSDQINGCHRAGELDQTCARQRLGMIYTLLSEYRTGNNALRIHHDTEHSSCMLESVGSK